MSTTARLLTYDDLLALPDDGKRYEIVDGELIEMASPEGIHQHLIGLLYLIIRPWVAQRGLGDVFIAPLDVRLSPHVIVQPDLIYLSAARFGRFRGRPVDGAPDLVIEVLSPSNRDYDERTKAGLYARHRVPEYWTVDAIETDIRARTLRAGRYDLLPQEGGILRSAVLPGLELDVAALFAEAV